MAYSLIIKLYEYNYLASSVAQWLVSRLENNFAHPEKSAVTGKLMTRQFSHQLTANVWAENGLAMQEEFPW